MSFSTGTIHKSSTQKSLVNIEEIPLKYRKLFQYPFFNKIQSIVFNDVLYSDKSIVVSAPTGSGKTVILEIAIVRLLMNLEQIKYKGDFKIVYMAPVKALCTERLVDWYAKFSQLGLPCIEVTGDTEMLDITTIKNYKIIMTTPEKWDSLTRRWKDHEMIVQTVKLFFIDEVHLLKEDVRGPVLEAVVSRMKTIQESINLSSNHSRTITCEQAKSKLPLNIRFIAISATIPNAYDIAEWLSTTQQPASAFIIGEEFRPVKLIKIVEGFPCKDGIGLFKFDMGLSYKIRPIIERYCEGKPTLIFCNTRKSVEMTADILSKELLFQFTEDQRHIFNSMSDQITEKKLKSLVKSGIGCHHAGFVQQDRNIIEEMFRQGDLPVLITTSTLAMGVNLPAHLVIIKTTQYYNKGTYQEYEDSTVLQMMGRAGRPQFDTEGFAVIMTKNQDKDRYVRLVQGQRAIESSLHRNLSEHLNAEVALGTLPDLVQAMDWIRSTFLYIRAVKNPVHYGFPAHNDKATIEKRLEELCMKCMNALTRAGMLLMDSNACVQSTEAGLMMAANCLNFETMKLIMKIKGSESLSEMIEIISKCHEFGDLPLRTGEKGVLNLLNKKPKGHERMSCRFPQRGKIQSKDMKVNCLIQAVFGCLPILDPSLNQESIKICRLGEHFSKCVMKYLTRPSFIYNDQPKFNAVLNSVILAKCFVAKLWENSPYVVKQFSGIGSTFASLLASSGKNSFQIIIESNPRDLERIINKQPPIGNNLKKQASLLPKYEINVSNRQGRTILVTISIKNADALKGKNSTIGDKHRISLVIGDSENNLLLYESISDLFLLNKVISKEVVPKTENAHTIFIHCISNSWVGIDVSHNFEVRKSFKSVLGPMQKNILNYIEKTKKITTKISRTKENDNGVDLSSPYTQHPPLVVEKLNNETRSNSNLARDKQCDKNKILVKKFDKNIGKINELIKTIPDPSQLNTLSSNVNYYKPLPKLNRHEGDEDKLLTNTNNHAALNSQADQMPIYLQNYYSRNENDESFNTLCENLHAENNEANQINGKSYTQYETFNSNNQSFNQTTEACDDDAVNLNEVFSVDDEDNHYKCSESNMLDENDFLTINKEYETFALDEITQPADVPTTKDNVKDDMFGITNYPVSEQNDIIQEYAKNTSPLIYCEDNNVKRNTKIEEFTNNCKKNIRTTGKKTKTIDVYYKQTKNICGPDNKKIKLDVQYHHSPPKLHKQNDVESNNKTKRVETFKSPKMRSIGTITEPDVENQNFTQCKCTDPNNQQHTNTDLMKFEEWAINVNNNEGFNQTKPNLNKSENMFSKNEIKIDININMHNSYNQMFTNNNLIVCHGNTNNVDTFFEQINSNQINVGETKKSISGQRFAETIMGVPQIKYDIPNIQLQNIPMTESNPDNSEFVQHLQTYAVAKIKEKMQEICTIKNIPSVIRNNFIQAINSVTELSSKEFLELYSIKKLNTLQNVENKNSDTQQNITGCTNYADTPCPKISKEKEIQPVSQFERKIGLNRILKDFPAVENDITNVQFIKFLPSVNKNEIDNTNAKNFQCSDTAELVTSIPHTSLNNTNPKQFYKNSLDLVHTNKPYVQANKEFEKSHSDLQTSYTCVDTTLSETKLVPNVNKLNASTEVKHITKGVNTNIESILRKYATNNNPGQLTAKHFNTERKTSSMENNNIKYVKINHNEPPIEFFLNSTRHEEVSKYYQDKYLNSQTIEYTRDRSYLQKAMQNYNNINTHPSELQRDIESIENTICEISQDFITDLEPSEENILDPQKVLAMAYTKEPDVRSKEIVYFDNLDDINCVVNAQALYEDQNYGNSKNVSGTFLMQNNTDKVVNLPFRNLSNQPKSNINRFAGIKVLNHLKQYKNTPKASFKM